VQTVFGEQEGAAFISGNGTSQPKGFLSETIVADASWAWTKIGYIASGADGAFAATDPSDALITLAYAPKQAYRANGTWVMNRKTEAVIRKFKDSQHNYIWQPGASAGQPATLFGYPVAEAEDMPDIASNAYAVAFGDFKRGYLIVDRIGVRVLRDPYSAKPYVLFYTTKRVGGGVQNFEAIKLMKFAAS
jgi:HK97 family phage major capsid protein